MNDDEVRSSILMMAQAVTTQDQAMISQAIGGVEAIVNTMLSTMAFWLRDFVRMNPSVFLGSKVRETPQEFLDEVYKVFSSMRVTLIEKAELDDYQLKDVAQI